MRNKFSSIARVKKQNLDKIAIKLATARAQVRTLESFIDETNLRIANFKLPASGDFKALKGELEILNLIRKDKETLCQRLELAKKSVMHFKNQYKNANLGYEKMKYLENEEFKQHIAKLKKLEQNMLDEFGVTRHAYLKGI